MNGSRRHSAGDGSFGKSTADAALRGALLVGVAVIIGALLLWKAHDDNASASIETTGGTPTTASTSPTTSVPRATTTAPQGAATTAAPTTAAPASGLHPPAEVKVLVANGTGTPAGAGTVSNKLKPKGYNVLTAADANSSTITASKIYYRAGYAEDAKQIARDLGVAAPVESIIEAMPATPPVKANAAQRATDANVLVVLGTDLKIKQT